MLLFNLGDHQDIDARSTMYPSYSHTVYRQTRTLKVNYSTIYGYAFGEGRILIGDKEYFIKNQNYFSFPVRDEKVVISTPSLIFTVVRLGFLGQQVVGLAENIGRLSHIDGSSNTLLVYPPRSGNPSLNFLYLPLNIEQDFHSFPTLRMGCVVNGKGYATLKGEEKELSPGSIFCLEPQELHRFRTENSDMRIIAYQPDSDWGPADENHTTLNKTYLAGK